MDPRIAPLAKTLAEENNVDWLSLAGTGPGGRVVEGDVLDYLARVMAGLEALDPTPEPLPAGQTSWRRPDAPRDVRDTGDGWFGPSGPRIEASEIEATKVEPTKVGATKVEPTKVEPTSDPASDGAIVTPPSPVNGASLDLSATTDVNDDVDRRVDARGTSKPLGSGAGPDPSVAVDSVGRGAVDDADLFEGDDVALVADEVSQGDDTDLLDDLPSPFLDEEADATPTPVDVAAWADELPDLFSMDDEPPTKSTTDPAPLSLWEEEPSPSVDAAPRRLSPADGVPAEAVSADAVWGDAMSDDDEANDDEVHDDEVRGVELGEVESVDRPPRGHAVDLDASMLDLVDPDVVPDVGSDVVPDVGSDVVPDVGSDVGSDDEWGVRSDGDFGVGARDVSAVDPFPSMDAVDGANDRSSDWDEASREKAMAREARDAIDPEIDVYPSTVAEPGAHEESHDLWNDPELGDATSATPRDVDTPFGASFEVRRDGDADPVVDDGAPHRVPITVSEPRHEWADDVRPDDRQIPDDGHVAKVMEPARDVDVTRDADLKGPPPAPIDAPPAPVAVPAAPVVPASGPPSVAPVVRLRRYVPLAAATSAVEAATRESGSDVPVVALLYLAARRAAGLLNRGDVRIVTWSGEQLAHARPRGIRLSDVTSAMAHPDPRATDVDPADVLWIADVSRHGLDEVEFPLHGPQLILGRLLTSGADDPYQGAAVLSLVGCRDYDAGAAFLEQVAGAMEQPLRLLF